MTENPCCRAEQGGRRLRAPAASALGGTIALLAALCALTSARAPRRVVVPLTPESITKVLAQGPHAGDCESCHTQHAGKQGIVYEHALVGPDENTLCDNCHTVPWSGGSYGGTWLYAGSQHGSSPLAVWPGPDPPARSEIGAAGKCLNCHNPHGVEDGSGLIPFLAVQREQNLCFACHDGSPAATNVRIDTQKPFNHPINLYTGRHTGPTESSPADFAVSPINQRHAECEDCHNPHLARGEGPLPPQAPEATKRLLGASRVGVLNGSAGSPPSYTFYPGSDTLTSPVTEYQLCFKCHSGWTVQPSGQTDLGVALNPANPSFHPVEAQGANANVAAAAFAAGWSATSLTFCGDCHGSDLGSRSPHGSTYRYILRAPSTASSASRSMTSNELCFQCHAYDVYADSNSPDAVQSASRFNAPSVPKGHADHVDQKKAPCYTCHATHGSTTLPHLIVTGRNPGVISYTETPTGGTCTATCHGPHSYTVNYGR